MFNPFSFLMLFSFHLESISNPTFLVWSWKYMDELFTMHCFGELSGSRRLGLLEVCYPFFLGLGALCFADTLSNSQFPFAYEEPQILPAKVLITLEFPGMFSPGHTYFGASGGAPEEILLCGEGGTGLLVSRKDPIGFTF